MSGLSRIRAACVGLLDTAAVLLTAVFLVEAAGQTSDPVAGDWRQWGGPNRNFISDATGLADAWGEDGPPVIWTRPLGLGHSSIAVDAGLLYTMYRRGEEPAGRGGRGGRGRRFEASEIVIAMDAATGETLWEYEYPSEPLNFSFGAGPHSTPLVVGDLVFTAGTNKRIHAFRKETGELVWSLDLVEEYGAPPTLIRVLAPFAVGDVTYPLARKGAYATEQVAGAISGRNLLHRNVLTSQHQQRTAQAPLRARSRAGQETEAILACNILNQMTQLGRPASYAIGR